jgi:hypothetical protein
VPGEVTVSADSHDASLDQAVGNAGVGIDGDAADPVTQRGMSSDVGALVPREVVDVEARGAEHGHVLGGSQHTGASGCAVLGPVAEAAAGLVPIPADEGVGSERDDVSIGHGHRVQLAERQHERIEPCTKRASVLGGGHGPPVGLGEVEAVQISADLRERRAIDRHQVFDGCVGGRQAGRYPRVRRQRVARCAAAVLSRRAPARHVLNLDGSVRQPPALVGDHAEAVA